MNATSTPSRPPIDWLALYESDRDRLAHVASRILGDRCSGEDLVHDAFSRLLDDLERWNPRNPHGYLHTMVTNSARSRLRHAAMRDRHAYRYVPDPMTPDVEVPDPDDRCRVRTALATLPRRQAQVLYLRYYCDLSESEIADQLGISAGAVKAHASRGRDALRSMLAATGLR